MEALAKVCVGWFGVVCRFVFGVLFLATRYFLALWAKLSQDGVVLGVR